MLRLLMTDDYIYDIETYPNFYSFTAINAKTGDCWVYEISDRRNDITEHLQFLWALADSRSRAVGFNNEGFDYPVVHLIMQLGESITVDHIYNKAMSIINCDWNDRFQHMIWESDRFIEQVDLLKIHHFDNVSKATSLKMLEFNMRSNSIEELPFEPGTVLNSDQMDVVLTYNHHDVTETLEFYNHSKPMIEFREELSERYDRNFINFNDTKIGKEYLIMELEKAGIPCYDKSSGRREPRQTIRHMICLGDVVLPYIRFDHPAFNRFLDWLRIQTITETKGVFKDLSVSVAGFDFVFGLGGIHGSIDSAIVEADEQYTIIDLDVTSFYPSLAIVNRLYPAHLGEKFCDIYSRLKDERVNHAKGSAINAMLKLGLNGTFGDSNSVYSPFYDPQFTMAITINGQLSLCMLAEQLMKVEGLRMIQANTDGVTVYVPRNQIERVYMVRDEWCLTTGLELEEALYSRMMIRDVNNYIAEYTDGKVKRKGAYEYQLGWHQNHSCKVVAKAAESALLDDENIENYIKTHPQPLDFMLRTKIPRGSKLMMGDIQLQNITRYYISNSGGSITKVMPPMKGKEILTFQIYEMPDGSRAQARTKTEIKKFEKKGTFIGTQGIPAKERRFDINKGWLITPCNNLAEITDFDFNYDWYINEARKLVDPLRTFK